MSNFYNLGNRYITLIVVAAMLAFIPAFIWIGESKTQAPGDDQSNRAESINNEERLEDDTTSQNVNSSDSWKRIKVEKFSISLPDGWEFINTGQSILAGGSNEDAFTYTEGIDAVVMDGSTYAGDDFDLFINYVDPGLEESIADFHARWLLALNSDCEGAITKEQVLSNGMSFKSTTAQTCRAGSGYGGPSYAYTINDQNGYVSIVFDINSVEGSDLEKTLELLVGMIKSTSIDLL